MKKKNTTSGTNYMRLESTTIMRSFLISLFCFCLGLFATAQTGPGGVGSSANNIVWLDAWEVIQTNGAPISNWVDQSGNGNNYSQATGTKQPVYFTNGFNGLPFIDFDGIDDALASGALSDLSNIVHLEIFSVMKSDFIIQSETIFSTEYQGTTIDKLFCGQYTSGGNYNSFGRNLGSSSPIVNSSFGNPAGHNILHTEFNINTNALRSLLNGTLVSTNSATRNPGTNVNSTLGTSYLNSYYFEGQIGDFVIFTSDLNALEEMIVVNSLAAKYAISIPSDYYAYQGTHNLNVIGIGNTSGFSHTSSQGKDVVGINTPSDLNSDEFMFVGHDNVNLASFSSNVPPSMIGGARFSRLWRVDKTGDVGTVTVVFDLDPASDFSIDPNNYRLFINNTSDFTAPSSSLMGTYNAVTNSVTFTNVSFVAGDFFTLAGDAPVDIFSVSSGNWSNAATWDCNCVPSQLNSVTINPAHVVEVDVASECLNLAVEATASLTMNSGSNLDIHGSFDLMGTLTAASGQISFVGTTAQSFDAGGATVNLNNVVVSNTNPAGVTFNISQYILNGTLSVNMGALIIPAGTGLIVNSTTSNTEGRIGTIPVGSSITGNVSVRRFIPAGLADWRDICSPVIGATFADWDPNLAMSGTGFPDGCAYGISGCFASVKYTINSISSNVNNVTDPITNGRGYNVFMGDDLVNFSGTTLTSTGTVNGSSNIPKSLNTGWHTIGNPYVSPMLYSLTTRTSQISNYFYVYDASIGDYQWYDGETSTSSIPELAGGLMNTFQGIWVYATSLGTITFHQTDKTTTGTFIRSQELVQDVSLKLILKENSSTYQSSILIEESLFATDDMDSLMDMRQLNNGFEAAPRISISTNEDLVRKNYIQDDKRNKSFNLHTKFNNAGYYTIEASNIENFRNYRKIVLFDNQTGDFIDLKTELSYTFYSEITEGQRFTLILTNEELGTEATIQSLTVNEQATENGLTITQMGHTFNVVATEDFTEDSQITLVNVLGQQVVFEQSVKLIGGSNLISIPEEYNGVYVLVITTGNEMVTKKVVL